MTSVERQDRSDDVRSLVLVTGSTRGIGLGIATHSIRRLGTVEDVAAAVTFLLSPGAAWITGELLGVTGGA